MSIARKGFPLGMNLENVSQKPDSSFEYLSNRIQISQKDTYLSTQEQSGANKHIMMQIGHINLTSHIKIDSSASPEWVRAI